MKTSVIRYRVADFLKAYPPFDGISEQDLLDLAGSGRVKFHQSDEYLFHQGAPKGELVWIIQQGRVELLEERASGEQLRDVLGEGDLLGLERFAGDGSYLFSARTTTDVILYGVAADVFEALVVRYPSVKRFLSAHFSVSGIHGFGRTSWLDAEPPSMEFLRSRLVKVPIQSSVVEAAPLLIGARNGVGALVDDRGRPVGIITAVDLCAANIGAAMLSARPCPPTIAAPLSTRAVVREMLHAHTEEIAITTDGTPDGALEALLTAAELALFCGCNPALLIRAIRESESAAEMMPLLRQAGQLVVGAMAQPFDIDDCCRIGTEVIAAMANACIRLACAQVAASGMDVPTAPSCWVMFGASARGDLLKPALPTIAAIYDDSSEDFQPMNSLYFAAVAGETLTWFHACGIAEVDFFWPEGSQPCMPLSEWRRLYCETIRNPLVHNLYSRREFFDVWPLTGDVSIVQKLHDEISVELGKDEMAIPLLANDTLAHLPPLTFFHGLLLELDGEQRDSFDIANAALIPITDAARVFAIARGHMVPANTLERLRSAQADFPDDAQIFREAADAFRVALYYQALAGGALINAGKLGRFDQLLLKTAFSSIHRLLELTTSIFIPSA